MKHFWKTTTAFLLCALLALSLAACSADSAAQTAAESGKTSLTTSTDGTALATQSDGESLAQSEEQTVQTTIPANPETGEAATQSGEVSITANTSSDGAMDASDLFSQRDLRQTADQSGAVTYSVSDGTDVTISTGGVYVLQGSAANVTVYVEAGDEDKVQLVLNGLTVANDSFPVIYVKNADKVFVTTVASTESSLSVTGTFRADGSTNTDAVIFSRDDLVLNGLGSLRISSTDNGVSCKDELKITGGVLTVSAKGHGLEANDGIAMADGTVSVTAGQDGLHAENDDDDREGWIYVCGGTLDVNAADDGLHAVSILQIDGGTLNVSAAEGMEGTWIQINDGAITIQASDDGINGARKSNSYTACVEINGGVLNVTMGQGDTDGIDSNGNLTITGGEINVNAQSPFDYDGTLTHTGGTVTVNGVQTTNITNQFGGGPGGGPGGGWNNGGRGRGH